MARTRNPISGITVRGFKSICDRQHIELRPLTILCGANSSGKSSFMQPLLLLKQTLEAAGDPGALLLDGPNVRFTSLDQLLSLSRSSGNGGGASFSVRIELGKQFLELIFCRKGGKNIEVDRMTYGGPGREFEINPDMGHDDILPRLPPPWREFYEVAVRRGEKLQWTVSRRRCFLVFELKSAERAERPERFDPEAQSISPSTMFVPPIQRVIHLPGLRGNPRRTYQKAVGGPYFQGTFEPYVAGVIQRWHLEDPAMLRTLGTTLEDMGVTWKVKAAPVDDTQVELRVGRLPHAKRGGAEDLVSIADVGFGVSQSLPVVVSLLVAQPGQLVYLEQPEIHLHPLAQRRLAHVLCAAAKRGVVVVVETHSAILLREVQTLVAKNLIAKENVKLHWFQRGDDGVTAVTSADLDDSGAYGKWPEDFDRTELDAEMEYLDAAHSSGTLPE